MGCRGTRHGAWAPDPRAGGSVRARPPAACPPDRRRATAHSHRTRGSWGAHRAEASPLDTRAASDTRASARCRAGPPHEGVPHVGCGLWEAAVPEGSTERPADLRDTACGPAVPSPWVRTPLLVRGAPMVE